MAIYLSIVDRADLADDKITGLAGIQEMGQHAVEICVKREDWMATLDHRRRQILEAMIQGDSNQELSARFKVSQGRISQHRREFVESWKEFRSTDDRKQRSEDFVEELKLAVSANS